MGLVHLAIDRGSPAGDYTSFCISDGTNILYLGSDPDEVRKYDVDVVIVEDGMTVDKLAELLKMEKSTWA